MITERLPRNDPRTIARDIPGILDSLFPELIPGVVAQFNRRTRRTAGCVAVPQAVIDASGLHRAMLFEVAVAAGEQLIAGSSVINWQSCLAVAVERQRRHFDAKAPSALSGADRIAATMVAKNLARAIEKIRARARGQEVVRSPRVPGYQWIASGAGDFSLGATLVEVKCTNKQFSAADYRQVLMYWLLSYAAAVETDSLEWSDVILLNPRLNLTVRSSIEELLHATGAGRSKVELLGVFSSMVGERATWVGD